MRERSTWNRKEVMDKAASLNKKADPYTMNQDHPQPSHDKYVIGDPSTFAEDVHSPDTWKEEYADGQTKRDEIGMPEMRSDTFNHSEKTAKAVLLKKADLAIAVARLLLEGKKTASEEAIEDQAVELMSLSDAALLATHARLAADDEEESEEEDEGQEKQAQDQEDSAEEEDEGQEKQAQDQQEEESEEEESSEDEGQQDKQAQDQQEEESEEEGQDKEAGQNDKANNNWKTADMQQMADMMQQMAQMMQQMMGQQQMPQQMPEEMAQMDQEMAQMDQGQMMQDDMMVDDQQALDQMLAGGGCDHMAESSIEMEPAPMDVGVDSLGPDDEVLRSLFAQDDSEEEGEVQEKQAEEQQAAVRSASTRTVGTRPTEGVSKLGGGTSKVASSGVDQLSNLWESAPDVRGYFGISK